MTGGGFDVPDANGCRISIVLLLSHLASNPSVPLRTVRNQKHYTELGPICLH